MIRTVLIFLLSALVSCASHQIRAAKQRTKENGRAVMHLIGRWSFGHACPVDGSVLSAAHMVDPFHKIPHLAVLPLFYAWSDQIGNSGYVQSMAEMPSRDLGAFYPLSGRPVYYKHSLAEPKAGDEIYFIQYDSDDPYGCKRKDGKIIRLVSGHIIIDEAPSPGASGSCLFLSETDEVVGIIVWAARTSPTKVVGIAVSIAGQWWPGQ